MKLTILIFNLLFVYCELKQQLKPIDDLPDKSIYPENNSIVQTLTSDRTTFEEEICNVEGRIMRVGEVIIPDPPKCYKITCEVKHQPHFEGCEKIKVNQSCYGSFYDMGVTYPKCCPKQVCPN